MFPSGKTGQVTVFIIVGILVLAISAIILFFVSNSTEQSLEIEQSQVTSTAFNPAGLVGFVESCIEETTIPALFLIAKNGGIIYPQDDSLILFTEYDMINYGWINGESAFSSEKIENDLEEYLFDYLYLCTDDFSIYSKQGFAVYPEYEKIDTKVTLRSNGIQMDVRFPITLETPTGDEVEVNDFSIIIQTNFGDMIDTANTISEEIHLNADLSQINSQEYVLTLFPYDDQTLVFSLTDENNLLDSSALTLFTALELEKKNTAPKLRHIADKAYNENAIWEEVLFADDEENDQLVFSSDSSEFSVTKEGYINSTMPQSGVYHVTFSVEDNSGLVDSQVVRVRVLEIDEE